ncbi:hypothetical protein NHQ30_008604 [Ciborinia camelliae]|nr:hypothetical protein NHQ30_008604 [Ciborinia camelliae]
MEDNSNLNPDDDSPDAMMDKQSNPNDSIFGIPNLFNNANFAQASIIENNVESTTTSPIPAHTSIFSDVPSSTSSPMSAQTSTFSSGLNSNMTSPLTEQTSIFGNAPKSIITSPHPIPPITPTPEVDLNAHDSEPDADLDANSDSEIDSDASSQSTSSSEEVPDFNAPAAPAPETLSLPSAYRSSPSSKCSIPTSLRDFSITFNSTKRNAAIKGQAQRVGAAGADKDDSGTYDPSLERKRKTRTRAKKNKENAGGEVSSKTGVGTTSERKTKEQGSSQMIVTIKVKNEKGLEFLRKFPPGPEGDERKLSRIDEADDEDSGDEDIDSQIHSKRRKRTKVSNNRRSDGLTLEELTDGHPQRRGCKSCFEAGDDGCSLLQYSHEWPCEACEDASIDCELIIPPELKISCIRCRDKLRKRCSYADDAGKGVDACKACENANLKCIAGPKAGSSNSMRMTEVLAKVGVKGKQGLNTKGESSKKVSAPAPTASVTKPQAMPRKWVPCNRCREEFKSRCSLKREDEGPCTRCVKADVPCTFTMLPIIAATPSKDKGKGKGKGKEVAPVIRTPADLTKTIILESTKLNDRIWRTTNPHARRTQAQQKAFDRAQSSSSSAMQLVNANPINHNNKIQTRTPSYKHNTPLSEALPPSFTMSHNGIRTIKITTAFSHPIIFNYRRDPMSLHPPCSFHSDPFFGLFGFGPRLVTVVPWPSINGDGYEELENGHGDSEVGEPQTRMCVKCTFARVKILGCEEHVMKVLPRVDQRVFDEKKLSDSVQACKRGAREGRWGRGGDGEPERGSKADLVWRAKWCAVCPSPGAWVCDRSVLEHGSSGRSQSNSSQSSQSLIKKGCGLILCDTCNDLHAKIQKGGKKGGSVVLGRVIQLAGERSKMIDYPDGVRSDAEFLTGDGELHVRMEKGGCGASRKEAHEKGSGNERGGDSDGVDSNEMSRASSNSLGGRKWKGKGVDRSIGLGMDMDMEHHHSQSHRPAEQNWKGKSVARPQPREILDSVVVTKGAVVSKPAASIAKWKGKGKGIGMGMGMGISGLVSDNDRDSDGEVVMKGMMVGDDTIRGIQALTGNFTGSFTGDVTGDEERSGRWKGKGVDRRVDENMGEREDTEMRDGGSEVMRSVEKEWEGKVVIVLSD